MHAPNADRSVKFHRPAKIVRCFGSRDQSGT